MNQHQAFGKAGEDLAVRYLKKKGYKVLEQNYTCPVGEIDIIARDKKTIVFVEVKTRRSMSYGSARLAITPHKQRKISMTALYYLKCQSADGSRCQIRCGDGSIHRGYAGNRSHSKCIRSGVPIKKQRHGMALFFSYNKIVKRFYYCLFSISSSWSCIFSAFFLT